MGVRYASAGATRGRIVSLITKAHSAIVVGVAVWATRYALRASRSVIVTLSLKVRSAI